MASMPKVADMAKKTYCIEGAMACARRMVAEKWGRERVPADLFPGQTDRAQELLAKG
jgi:hypothetical protein